MHRSRLAVRPALVAGLLLLVVIVAGRAAAQSIQINAGSSPTVRVLPGGKLAVPIIVDLSSAGALDIAAFAVALNWAPASLSFDSLRVAPGLGWVFTPDIAGAGGGTLSFTTSNASPLATTSTFANLFLTAGAAASGTRITPSISAAFNAAQQNILTAMRPRRVDVCVAISGKWGDATNDNAVNIVDAQQIARFSVGLGVFDANAVAKRGDVTNDAAVNIIDAQQVARFSVALPAAVRTGNDAFTQPTPTSAEMVPAGTHQIGLGGAVQMTATPSNATAGDLTGCESFIWSSNNPGVASVNGTGFVSGLSFGTATITATALSNPAVSVSANIVVQDPSTLRIAITHAGRAAKQYIAEVTGGGFSSAEGFVLSGTNMNGGVLLIPVPSTGTYVVRMVAIDAASTANRIVSAGGTLTVNVAAGGTSDHSLTLTSPTYSMLVVPATVRLGATAAVSWRVTDPALLIDGQERGIIFCGTVHTSINVMASDFSGTQSDACGVTITGAGILTYSNSTTPIAPQVVPGSLRMQMRATQLIRTGIGSATDVLVHWVSPSVTRGEAPLSITVPALVQVQVLPDAPSIAAGTTRQMSAVAEDALGVITGLPIVWSAPVPSVATVSTTGLVTGITPGQAPIIATIATKIGGTVATVTAGVIVGSVTVEALAPLTGNGTTTAVATARDANGVVIPNAALTWSTSNFRIARVSPTGNVHALGAGSAQITATAGGVSGSATLTVNPTAQAFSIVLRPRASLPAGVTNAFTAAAQRWSQIIRGDVPNATLVNADISACLGQAPGTTVLNEIIDDVVIYTNVASIDGASGVLAEAGPCMLRDAPGQTIIGIMTIDAADVNLLELDGTLTSVILHEMGHVLGIGTNWGSLLQNPAVSPGVGDPTFVGANAQWAFSQLGTGYAGAIVPVENCCGDGTRNAHWRESALLRELMTGFLTVGGINPLSPLTAASLIDIGYVVDVNQSDFPPSFLRTMPNQSERRVPINERVIAPRFTVGPSGRTSAIGTVRAPVRAPVIRRND